MTDYIYHGRIEPFHIGFAFAVCPGLANEAIVRHDCDPLSAHLLGRALNAGLLLTPGLEHEESLNLHWTYTGSLQNVLVDLRGDGRVRGLINPAHLAAPGITEAEVFGGDGKIQVVRSRGDRILSSGTAECALQQLTEDLGYYLSISEQVESALNVMIDFAQDPEQPVSLCQGILLQALPQCDPVTFDRIRNRLHQNTAREVLAQPAKADGHFEKILNDLFKNENVKPRIELHAGPEPQWFCTCGEEKIRRTLHILPPEDREDLIKKNEPVVIRCDFCNTQYPVSIQEAQSIWSS